MPKKKAGRPSEYDKQYAKQAQKLCELGATDKDIGAFFGVSDRTIRTWKTTYADFSKALTVGKKVADDQVERSLYTRALGYSHESQKIFNNNGVPLVVDFVEHYPPDTTACIFWLKNRRRDEWRDKHDIDVSATSELAEFLKESRERVKED